MGRLHPQPSRWRPARSFWLHSLLFAACLLAAATGAWATPGIVVDVATGNVLYEDHADEPWYPASLTKLMTIYVALSAVRDKEITLDTPLVVSARAASMAPSKMGFSPGTEVTLDNALKMLIVKSANDIAVTVAEGIAGSVDAFADDMNRSAAQLGMTESHFVNPNGLHDPEHVSSARDLAILARALYVQFPDYAGLFGIGALRLGEEIIPTHNDLLGRYPGADGMKTGFTCAAGFNLVASAERGGRRYIAVVLGAPSIRARLVRTAVLLDRAFAGIDHPHPMVAGVSDQATAPDMHNAICRNRARTEIEFEAETERLEAPLSLPRGPTFLANGYLFNPAPGADEAPAAARIAMMPTPVFDPVAVYIGPAAGYSGPVAAARPPHSPIGTPMPETASVPTATPQASGDVGASGADKYQTAAHEPNEDDEANDPAAAKSKSKAKDHVAQAKGKSHKLAKARSAKTAKLKSHKLASKGKSKTAKNGKAKPAKLADKPKLKTTSSD